MLLAFRSLPNLAHPQGLPVFYAPGEAEATCAALNRAGCVDGCASSDSDTLLYGAEAVYHTLKLQVSRAAWQRRGYTGALVYCNGNPIATATPGMAAADVSFCH